jgi:hypothetical protein
MTIELGQIKCLLILGVSESRFRQADFCLAQHDTDVLAMKIFTRSTGEDIAELLEELCARSVTLYKSLPIKAVTLKKHPALSSQTS